MNLGLFVCGAVCLKNFHEHVQVFFEREQICRAQGGILIGRRYMAKILPIQRKTLYNQSINQS